MKGRSVWSSSVKEECRDKCVREDGLRRERMRERGVSRGMVEGLCNGRVKRGCVIEDGLQQGRV